MLHDFNDDVMTDDGIETFTYMFAGVFSTHVHVLCIVYYALLNIIIDFICLTQL